GTGGGGAGAARGGAGVSRGQGGWPRPRGGTEALLLGPPPPIRPTLPPPLVLPLRSRPPPSLPLRLRPRAGPLRVAGRHRGRRRRPGLLRAGEAGQPTRPGSKRRRTARAAARARRAVWAGKAQSLNLS